MASIPFCVPCHRGNNPSEATSWCSDCVESLCQNCDSAHRINKITLSHNLIRIEEIPPDMSETLSSQKYCPTHKEYLLDLYCITHDALCCTSCMTQRHRGCGRLIPLDVVAKGVRQAHVLEVVSGDIEDILKSSQILHDNQMENLKQLQTQTDTITKAISDVKQTIVDRLDRFEHALLSELSTMHLIKSSNVEKQDETISKFIEKAKERKNKLEFIKEYGSNSQVFIKLQKLKLSVKEEQKRLKILRHSLKYIYIMYNQQKKQESLSTSLGTLTTKMEPVITRSATKGQNVKRMLFYQ